MHLLSKAAMAVSCIEAMFGCLRQDGTATEDKGLDLSLKEKQ